MRGVRFTAPGQVTWEELADPRVEHPRDAVVAVELAGICGSDLHPFFGRERGLDPGTVMGHEFVAAWWRSVPTFLPFDRAYDVFAHHRDGCVKAVLEASRLATWWRPCASLLLRRRNSARSS